MTRIVKNHIKFAMFLLFVWSAVASAEVKLRLYLKDGSLLAGNLVTETDKTLVILSKNGREEVAKDTVMFVNGKTLQYWKDHPEKYYQTEIIPSEIPNPAYVNDKAALPAPPTPPQRTEIPAVIPPAVPPTPVTPVVRREFPTSPTVVKEKSKKRSSAEQKLVSNRRVRRKRSAPIDSASKSPPIREIKQTMIPSVNGSTPRIAPSMSREEVAAIHAEAALNQLKSGRKGRAMQHLHYAVILNPREINRVLLLARLYVDEGVAARAAKLLSNPGLRKNEEARSQLERIKILARAKKLRFWMLLGFTGLGLVLIIPLLILIRRWPRKAPPALVLTAEEAPSPVIPLMVGEIQENFLEEDRSPPAAIKSPEPEIDVPAPVEKTEMAPPPFPVIEVQQNISELGEGDKKSPEPSAPDRFDAKPSAMINALPEKVEPNSPPPTLQNELTPPEEPPESEESKSVEPSLTSSDLTMPILNKPSSAPLEDMGDRNRIVAEIVSRGHAHVAAGDPEAARKEYRTALALNSQCEEAILGIAYLCFIQGNWDLAKDHYEHVIQINPQSADGHYGVGRVFLETGHVSKAVVEFRLTLKLDPTLYEARETLLALGVAV